MISNIIMKCTVYKMKFFSFRHWWVPEEPLLQQWKLYQLVRLILLQMSSGMDGTLLSGWWVLLLIKYILSFILTYFNFTEFMYMFFQIFRKSLKFHQYKQSSWRVYVNVSKGIYLFDLFQISMSVCNSPVLMEVLALTSRARTSVDVLWAGPATTVK